MSIDEWDEWLDAHPDFRQRLYQFTALHDAAAILDELQPPHGDTAAAYLREIGNHLIREAGIPEEFLQEMIKHRKPSLAETARRG